MKINKCILKQYPTGIPQPSDFEFTTTELEISLSEGQVLVKILYISVDPYLRVRINKNSKGYFPPFPLGEPIVSGAIGEILESKDENLKKGTIVKGMFPWQDYCVIDAKNVAVLPYSKEYPPSYGLGILGMPGLTAYFSFLEIGQPKKGDVVLVSGAAGAVGMVVGQLAKIYECYVVGIAGSDEKCDYIVKELGFDKAINYKKVSNIHDAIVQNCPDGIDIYYDNVGGETLDAAITNMKNFGRLVICGQISNYNDQQISQGPRLFFNFVSKNLKMEGFLVGRYSKQFPEGVNALKKFLDEGKLKYHETVEHGFDKIIKAFQNIFTGGNTGKQIIHVADPE